MLAFPSRSLTAERLVSLDLNPGQLLQACSVAPHVLRLKPALLMNTSGVDDCSLLGNSENKNWVDSWSHCDPKYIQVDLFEILTRSLLVTLYGHKMLLNYRLIVLTLMRNSPLLSH